MSKEIPRLSVLVLKEIAKAPGQYLSATSYEKAIKIFPATKANEIDFTQTLVNYITDAGRYTDDIIPVSFFDPTRNSLCLKNTKVSSKYIIKILDRCPFLETIDVSGTFLVDDNLIMVMLQKCQHLKYLNIRNCRKITDQALQYLTSSATTQNKIVSLNIGGNINITEKGLIQFLSSSKASQLTELYISGLPINDSTLILLSKKCTQLKCLGISYANVSEDGLHKFLTSPTTFPGVTIGNNLETLHLAWIGTSGLGGPSDMLEKPQLSSDFFTLHLVNYCPKLTELDVSGLKNITSNSLLNYLDQRWRQVEAGGDNVTLRSLKAKFVGSSKQVLEQNLALHSYIKLEL